MRTELGGVTAAILAGGLGTRLQGIVTDRPKGLAPVLGRPYLAYLLDHLSAAGIQEVVLLTGHLAEQIESELGRSHNGMTLTYSREEKALGTGGAVRHALKLFRSRAVMVLNGDSFWGINLNAFWDFHTRHRSAITLGVTRVVDASRYGSVQLRGERVVGFNEKQRGRRAGWISTGIYVVPKKRIEEIPPGGPVSLERDMFPVWVKEGQCFAYSSTVPFMDIGTPESYANAGAFFRATQKEA